MKKITNLQTKDYILDILRKEILSGKIPDGREITQEQIAQELNISRMPVREALQVLEMEGLIVRLRNRHIQVSTLNEKKAKELLRVIAVIESELIDIIIEQNIDYEILEYKLKEYQSERNLSKGQRIELSLHMAISELIQNSYLTSAHLRMLHGYPKYIIENYNLDKSGQLIKLTSILEAIRKKDKEAARYLVKNYFISFCDIVFMQ